MRVLLLDNHDSFSAILHHYLWELTGERPLFFRNDELSREELEATEFDAAVLSPGPGHPANVRDFGVCRDLLELFPRKPVLGVCLGMQGMAHFAGARVVPWAGALHGRPSRIDHDGRGLFHGLPSGFSAIRYHSLVVDPDSLPANLRVTSRSAEDGRIMSIAFTDRPWFGVQFHPESLGTEHGKALLSNFLDLARPDRSRPEHGRGEGAAAGGSEPKTPGPEFRSTAYQNISPVTVPFVELPWRDPGETFARFFETSPSAFWLDGEHARKESGWPCTVMGRADRWIEIGTGSIRKFEFDPDAGAWKAASVAGEASLESVRRCLGGARAPRTAPWPGYTGGPIGQFDYEWNPHATSGASKPVAAADEPAGRWMLPDGWLAFDHAARRVFAAWESAAMPGWLQATIDAWDAKFAEEGRASLRPVSGRTALPAFEEWRARKTGAEYTECVSRLQDAIARGESYEACLTHAYSVASDADPLAVFLRVRAGNPAPYAAFLRFPHVRILSASPELFLEGTAAGVLRSRPIKGTRRRGGDAESDRALRGNLRASEKDAAENRMITDLTRNDLARVCVPGSIEVPAFLEIEEHPAVFQMVSEVRGRLAKGVDLWDALAACFPGGSMTGAPKERTVELLRSVEGGPRGIYSGALGYLTGGGAFVLSMVIRTLVSDGREWTTGCGGAVLIDSDPEAEWREATVKARSVIDAAAGRERG